MINLEDIEFESKACDIVQKAARDLEVRELKQTYSREYLINHGFCTEQEYDSIPTSTEQRKLHEKAKTYALLADQIVGAERF